MDGHRTDHLPREPNWSPTICGLYFHQHIITSETLCVDMILSLYNKHFRGKRQHRHQTMPCIDWKLLRCVIVLNFSAIMNSWSHILVFWHWIMLYLQGQELVWSQLDVVRATLNATSINSPTSFLWAAVWFMADSKTSAKIFYFRANLHLSNLRSS